MIRKVFIGLLENLLCGKGLSVCYLQIQSRMMSPRNGISEKNRYEDLSIKVSLLKPLLVLIVKIKYCVLGVKNVSRKELRAFEEVNYNKEIIRMDSFIYKACIQVIKQVFIRYDNRNYSRKNDGCRCLETLQLRSQLAWQGSEKLENTHLQTLF